MCRRKGGRVEERVDVEKKGWMCRRKGGCVEERVDV